VKSARYQVGEGTEGGLYLRDLRGVGFDEGGVGSKPLRREVEVGGWDVGMEAGGEGGGRRCEIGAVDCHCNEC
jgi:hypothetical protein